MAYTIPNNSAAFNANQAIWMQADIDALAFGVASQGVYSGCTVTAQAVPDMTVAVAAGSVTINGVPVKVAAGNVTITTADATNPRIDIVSVNSSGVKAATAGTAAASPEAPAHPSNSVILAMVYVPAAVTSIATNKITDKRVLLPSVTPGIVQGRLTTESGVPVSTSDRTAQATLYYTPYLGKRLSLYDGVAWGLFTAAEVSLSLSGLTSGKNYDVFIYNNAGTLTLELSAAWASNTARTDALTTQDGIYVKGSDATRLWLGTIRATGTTTTEDSGGGSTTQVGGKRFVWNAYNQVPRWARVIDTADTWSYTTDTWRVANGATAPANGCEWVTGLASTMVSAEAKGVAAVKSNSAKAAKIGVGIDGSSPSGLVQHAFNQNTGQVDVALTGKYVGTPGLGYHYAAWLEKGADVFCTFAGDNAADGTQSGLDLWLLA